MMRRETPPRRVSQKAKRHDKERKSLFAVSENTKGHGEEGSPLLAVSKNLKRHDE
jgi:hypothetical protein